MASSNVIRDPVQDQLLTPQNAALVVIDYQPVQVASIQSRDKRSLVANITSTIKLAKLFGLPIVLSTVNVKTGINQPTIKQISSLVPNLEPIDRTAINAWEDDDFVAAVKATGRKKLVMTALWTEACLTFPALDALKEGYEVFPVVDAIGGTSLEAHNAGLERIIRAGAKPTSWVQFACELQRDWRRAATAKEFAGILFAVEGN
jgi:nicotinamidase-related amidase